MSDKNRDFCKFKEIDFFGCKIKIYELQLADIIYIQDNLKDETTLLKIAKEMLPRCVDNLPFNLETLGFSALLNLVKVFVEVNKDFLQILASQKNPEELKKIIGWNILQTK